MKNDPKRPGREALPAYDDLMKREDAPPGSAWGLFGQDDQIGTVNLLDAEAVRNAAQLVRRGATFNLDYELDAFQPAISPFRKNHQHVVNSRHDGQVRDDFVTDFYMQASSQIDGLRHHRHSVYGSYGGIPDSEISSGSSALGIQHVAQHGIVGRGVLLDVARYLKERGRPIDLKAGHAITVADLEGAAQAQGVTFRTGDILLLHTDWARHFLEEIDQEERLRIIREKTYCGLLQSRETMAWIWDRHFSVVASDTVAVEVRPVSANSPFTNNIEKMMHPDLIALLGISLGELWKLDTLAADCAADGAYECMVIAKPLNLVGGVGSPANAVALK